jgi:hypothetical protein
MSDPAKKMAVDERWLGRVIAYLDEARESDPRAQNLYAEASSAIEDKLVPIRVIDLQDLPKTL